MNKLKLFLKSIAYSFQLMYQSSGLLIVVYLFVTLLGSTLSLCCSYVLKFVLDSLVKLEIQSKMLFVWIIIYITSLVFMQIFSSIQNVLQNSIFTKAEHLYECNLAKKLSELPLSIIDSSEGRDMIEDVRYTKNTAVYTAYRIVQITSLLYTFIIAYVTLAKFNLLFSLLFLLLTVPGIILNEFFDKKAEILRIKTAPDVRKFCYYRWMLTDVWPAKDVRMYDLTRSIKKRYNEEKEQYLQANKKFEKKKLFFMLLLELFKKSGEISFTVFVIIAAIHEKISIGDVSLYIGFALIISSSFENLLNILVMGYTRSTEIMGRLFEFFSLETKPKEKKSLSLDTFESLSFDNVYFKYPHTEKYILCGTSFVLNKGDKLSIVGVNGSGKSTIIKLMLGLYEIESGQILINGKPIHNYNMQDVRQLFSVLFQDFVQYPLTLRENIGLSALEKMLNDTEIEQVLSQSGVYGEIENMLYSGIDSFMTRSFDDNGIELSKGQWQKIALARAYFKNTPILIFDEPSAALDAEAEDRIFKNFEQISNGKTGVMISHRISSARMSNKIIVLDNGRISEEGTHEELLALNGLYAKLYNLQREKYIIKES